MKHWIKEKSKIPGALLIVFFVLYSFVKIHEPFKRSFLQIIQSDGIGYYSYLPAIFIYNDYSQSFVQPKFDLYYKDVGVPQYMNLYDGRWFDKYFSGTAILQAPFFLAAHLVCKISNQPADGYSLIYQYGISFAGIFYLFSGLFFIYKLIRKYDGSPGLGVLVTGLICFGTNLFHYAIVEPSMSHVYSFAIISAFIYFSYLFFNNHRKKDFLWAVFLLALVTAIRPVNGLVVLVIPFISGSLIVLQTGLKTIFSKPLWILQAIILAFIPLSFQLFVWYKQTGHLIVMPYSGERFYFDHPNILNVLFSYKKGFFIYTPLALISMVGLIRIWRYSRFAFVSFLTFFIILTYVTSCWHSWFYGGSFGFRPFIDYLALFGLLLFNAFNVFKSSVKKSILIVICLLTVPLNLVQATQYRRYIIHMSTMTTNKYWKLFLKTDGRWNGYPYRNMEGEDVSGDTISSFSLDFEASVAGWQGGIISVEKSARSGKKVMIVNTSIEYGITWNKILEKEMIEKGDIGIIVEGWIKPMNGKICENVLVAASVNDQNDSLISYADGVVGWNLRPKMEWQRFSTGLRLKGKWKEGDRLKLYFWNIGQKAECQFDDLDVTLIQPIDL